MSDTFLIARNQASLEYDASAFRAIGSNLHKGLTLYINDMSRYMSNVFAELNGEALSFTKNEKLIQYVEKSSYISMSEVALPVPTGLNTDMLEFLDALELNQGIVDSLVEKCFKPAYTFFATLLATPENLSSVSISSQLGGVQTMEKERNIAKAAVAKCFIKNDRVEYMRYGDLYARHKDFATAQDRFQELSARLTKVPPATLRKYVDDICEVLDRLAVRIKQDPETYATNGINAKKISDISFELATAAEFYAAHFFLMKMTNSVMEESNKKLRDIV